MGDMKKVRQSNLELLRILALLGVVLLHYNNESVGGGFAYVAEGSANQYALRAVESLFICAVNVFVMLSGYFSVASQKRSASKAFALLLQVSVFRVGICLLGVLRSGSFSLGSLLYSLVPVNYYVILYVALYLVSPYLNILLNRLDRKQLTKLLVLTVALFSVYPTAVDVLEAVVGQQIAGLSTIGLEGSQAGYTIVNFVVVYLVGAYLRLADVDVKKRWLVLCLAGCAAALTLWSCWNTRTAWAYCNPLVILEAACLLLLFKKIDLRSKAVNTLAASSFTCFLLHSALLSFFGIGQAVRCSLPVMLGHMVLTAVVIYLVCWCVYVCYNWCAKPVVRLADRLFERIGLDFSVEDPM